MRNIVSAGTCFPPGSVTGTLPNWRLALYKMILMITLFCYHPPSISRTNGVLSSPVGSRLRWPEDWQWQSPVGVPLRLPEHWHRCHP